MTFEIPDEFFTVASAGANAQSTRKALEAQSAEMRKLLQQGKDIPCPYCAQLIAKDAFVCSQCQGVLSIGSWEAIRLAIHLEPTLAYRDAETIERLTVGVREIDEYWAEQAAELAEAQRLSEQQRIDEENQRRREAEIAREESIRASEEARKVAAAKEQARIEALGPFRKWCATHKPLLAGAAGSIVVIAALSGLISVSHANAARDKANQVKVAAEVKKSCTALVPQLTAHVPKLKHLKSGYLRAMKSYGNVSSFSDQWDFTDGNASVEKSVARLMRSMEAQRIQGLKVLRTSNIQGNSTRVNDAKILRVLDTYRAATSSTRSSAWVSKIFAAHEAVGGSGLGLYYTEKFFTSSGSGYTPSTNKHIDQWIAGQGPLTTYLGLERSWTDLIKSCKAIR